MKKIQVSVWTVVLFFAMNSFTQAGVLVDFSLSDWTVDDSGNVTSPVDGPFTATDAIASEVVNAQVTGYGLTIGGSGNYAGELNYASWNQPGNNDRLEIEISIADGMQVDLTGLTLNIVRNGTAAPTDLNVSFTDDVVIGSISGIAVRNGSEGALPGAGFEQIFDLSSAASQSGTFTLWVKTPNSAKTGNLRINNIVLEGNLSVIPEPCTLGLLALGGLLIRKR